MSKQKVTNPHKHVRVDAAPQTAKTEIDKTQIRYPSGKKHKAK